MEDVFRGELIPRCDRRSAGRSQADRPGPEGTLEVDARDGGGTVAVGRACKS